MDVLVGPVHFGNVNQAFNAFFQLGEAAVVGQVGDLGGNASAFRITTGDSNPRIFAQLLQTQRNAVALAVELQDLDVDLVANVDDLGRMLDTLPRHVGNVQQAIDAAQVDERTVIGEVLDDTLDDLTFLQGFQQGFALGGVLGFQDSTTGNDNVVALLVQLDDLEFQFLVFPGGGVTYGTYVNQRARQERTDGVDVDGKATFDLAVDDALDDFFCSESSFEDLPRFGALGLLAGQLGFTETVFDGIQCNVHLITHSDGQFALFVQELITRDNTL